MRRSDQDLVPVYKASALWRPSRHHFSELKSSAWQLDMRFWFQVGEWFEIKDGTVLDRLFTWEFDDVPAGRQRFVNKLRSTALQ